MMNRSMLSFLLLLVLCASGSVFAQKSAAADVKPEEKKIPWKLTVIVLDGADMREAAEIPVTEAVAFIERYSRFKFEVQYVKSATKHSYTPYVTGKGRKKETRYAMMGWNVPKPVIDSLPVSTSYLFLYKLFGKLPAQAGSALGIDFGLMKGGKPRTYATVTIDQWWYKNEPASGFYSAAAQVLTHEIINTIQGKLEAPPFKCGQLAGEAKLPSIFESQRLEKISDKCYEKLGKGANW